MQNVYMYGQQPPRDYSASPTINTNSHAQFACPGLIYIPNLLVVI